MKKYLSILTFLTALIYSCSTDGNDEEMTNDSALVGTWNLTDVRFDQDPNDTSLNLADEIVDELFNEDCVLVSFTFSADGTVSSTDKLNFIEVNASPTGLDIPCPTDSLDESCTWSFDGNQLTCDDCNGTVETLTIQF